MGSKLGRSEEEGRRPTNWGCNAYMHRNNIKKLPV
jgi:hypothetical protein